MNRVKSITPSHDCSFKNNLCHLLSASSGKCLAYFHIMQIILQIYSFQITQILRHACRTFIYLPVKLL